MEPDSSHDTRELWRRLNARSQSNLYFALAFLPAARREAFRDVYRFLRAADDVADSALPPAEIHRHLDEWRGELDAVYGGRAQHPISLRLAAAVQRFSLTRAHFETILDALAEDVGSARRFASYPALERWCAAVSATLGYLCLEILEVHGEAARAYAREVGVALQLANIVRDVAEDASRGRIYLPQDELAASGCSETDVLACRYSPAFAAVAEQMAGRIRAMVAKARSRLHSSERRALLVPEIWADVYLALLVKLEQRHFDVFSERPYLRRRHKLVIAAKCLIPRLQLFHRAGAW